jgi:hypothetical protein
MRKRITLAVLLLISLLMFSCSSNETNYVENNPSDSLDNADNTDNGSGLYGLVKVPVLFAVARTGGLEQVEGSNVARYKQGGTSSLYLINPLNGTAALIGDIGYEVMGIAYNSITGKLYGITWGPKVTGLVKTTARSSLLIEIDTTTGAGTPVGATGVANNCLTISPFGTLYSWNQTDNVLCTIDTATGVATSLPTSGIYPKNYGLAFNNFGVLYLVVEYAAMGVYTLDSTNGSVLSYDALYGVGSPVAHHGDFNPLTGKYWGISASDDSLRVIDLGNNVLENTIPTIDNLQAITFGFVDLATLSLMGLNQLDFELNPPN